MENQRVNDPNLLNHAHKTLTGAGMTRTKVRKGSLAREKVTHETPFQYAESTAWDETNNAITTTEEAVHWMLDCGCRISAPSQVGGICKHCAPGMLTQRFRRVRYVCGKCGVCVRCRRKQERSGTRPGCAGVLLAVLLWPVADVSWDE
jgi:hypothetical protein